MTRTDVLLIATRVISDRESFYIPDFEIPLNVCYLAAAAEQNGLNAAIVDMNVAETDFSIEKYAAETQPRLAGFAAYTPFVFLAHDYARRIKAASPDTLTVVGGYHASALPEQTLAEFPAFDFLVYGEGERTLTELARAIQNGDNDLSAIPGLCWRSGSDIVRNEPRAREEHIDVFPFPARHMLHQERYKVNPINYVELPTTGILASRGCDHRCAFCSQSVFGGRARVRSADNIADEVQQCVTDYGMRGFRFYDDNLTAYRDTCLAFCDEVLKRKFRINWNCFSRVDRLDPDLLRAMKRAGCHQLKLGVETGTDKGLDTIKKGITLDQSRAAVAMTRRAGIECQISMILGLPDETVDEMQQTIRFVKELSPDLAGFNLFKPLPGSTLFKKLDREGRLLHKDWADYSIKQTRSVVRGDHDQELLEKMLRTAYVSFFFRPRYVLQRLRWFVRYPRRETIRLFTGLKYMWLSITKSKGK
jgi:radical SAM superfamily enzyme YgiQ (UPF0313 family)